MLQDLVEQLVQLEEEALIRLEPPPIPKHEIIFWTSADPHSSQTTSLSLPGETRRSNLFPHFLHVYSYKGISSLFYRNSPSRSTGRAERSVMSTEAIPESPPGPGKMKGGSPYLTSAMASISTLTSRGSRATWTAARAGLGALKNSA